MTEVKCQALSSQNICWHYPRETPCWEICTEQMINMSSRGSMSPLCRGSKGRGGTPDLRAGNLQAWLSSLHEKQVQYFLPQERAQLSSPFQLPNTPQIYLSWVSGMIFLFFLLQGALAVNYWAKACWELDCGLWLIGKNAALCPGKVNMGLWLAGSKCMQIIW